MFAADDGEGDHFLQCRRPGGGGGFADLTAATEHWHGYARGHTRDLRGHALLVEDGFDLIPIDFEPDEGAWRSAPFGFGGKGVATDEAFLFQIDKLAETDFARAELLRRDKSFFAGGVIDFNQDETCFDACDVERDHSSRMNVEGLAFFHQAIPNLHCLIGGNPDFVAEGPGVAGAGNVQRYGGDFGWA